MSVLAEYTLGAGDVVLGRAASDADGPTVHLERLLQTSAAPVCYVWTEDGGEEFERALETQSAVESVAPVDDASGRLYRSEVREDGTLLGALAADDVEVLQAEGDDDRWTLLIEFPDEASFREFQRRRVEAGDRSLDVAAVYDAPEPSSSPDTELTERQRQTLLTAYREGYFEIPRRITLVDLANELGVSDQAVSERLRRGEAKLVRSRLFED